MLDSASQARRADPIPTLTLVGVGVLALAAAWALPWWRMEARAPQYGKQALTVQLSPAGIAGDVAEIDTLGHYVGIKPMASFGRVEQALGPLGLVLALAGLLLAPWLVRRRWRVLALVPLFSLPVVFCADVSFWMSRGTNHRDPTAALTLTVTHIDTRLFGRYAVGQFDIQAAPAAGLFGVCTSALLAVGLVFAAPLSWPRRRRRTSRAGVLAALLVGGTAGSARADDVWVEAGQSIAAAMAAAEDGDTLRIRPGLFTEHLVVDRPLHLEGEPGATLDGEGQGSLVVVRADGASLSGLRLQNSGERYTSEDTGVRIDGAKGVRLADLEIVDTLFGVFAVRADDCELRGLRILGKALPPTRRGDAIRLWYSHRCAILANEIERSRDLIIWYSEGTRVEDNLVRHSRYGLHYMYSDHNTFRRNRFEDNQVGAAIMYSRGVTLRENSFAFANGPSAYGALIKDADDIFIEGNRFVGNATGLFFDGAPQARGGRVEVHQNLIAQNGVGIMLEPRNRGIELWENAFVGNQTQVQLAGAGDANGNRWERGGRGNYWSDALPYDRDGDGISELPYEQVSTYESLAQGRAELAFFAATPAAEALDLAARLFPLFAPRPRMTDPRPLVEPVLTAWTAGPGKPPGSGLGAAALLLAAGGFALLFWARRVLA